MINNLQSTTTLNNGVKMPWFGIGVFKVEEGPELVDAIKFAIKHGYRSIDTAAIYENEESVGQAILAGMKETGVSRQDLFITSKVWNADLGYESTIAAYETSLKKLGLDYLDLYLIHWPVEGKYKEAKIKPMVNQVEYHPRLTQKKLQSFCQKQGIQLEAWSPLMQGQLLDNPELLKIANKYNKSIAQIILRWDLQNGVVTIPKSTKEHRIVENSDVFDFELSKEDMEQMDRLNQDHRVGPDPDNFDF
ncbi:diketogulonate reductase-like aldo/keto reductase [Fontibacillus solani]|uniref:Diketogulonate reductase-like aldo/keto reductase n=1 Tax=Fontibacillus solani TaxID=1572857 RepID=A0A7W3STU9_9BACL|nr:aldo/keto reductase [Fontibacillus solani]MBA9085994.1 diketogulonate reductase-like aldo/keto reductase [Fontibacillus solani]